MSEKVHPSFNRRSRNREIAAAIQYGGGSEGWVVPSDERLVEDSEGDVSSGPLGAFDYVSSSGFDVTIDTGEGLVEGAYLSTDEQHTVTLASSTSNQTVYIGWMDGQADTVAVGLDSAFGSVDHQIPIWTFSTDSTGVTSATDERRIGNGSVDYIQTTEPEVTNGATWVNPDTGVFYVGYSDDWHPIPPVQITEEAATFSESDVTVTTSSTQVSNGSIQLPDTVTRPADGSAQGSSGEHGLVFSPNEDAASISFLFSENTSGLESIGLRDLSSSTDLASRTGSYNAGDRVTFEASLSAGTDYLIWTDKPSSGSAGRYGGSPPWTGGPLDIVDGWEFGSRASDRVLVANDLSLGDATTGNALIEWDSGAPEYLESWDLATFQRTLDSETVMIDVEDGSGNVLYSDIGQNFNISTVDSSKNVKLRANLSRTDTTNNPSLDYAARRFTR